MGNIEFYIIYSWMRDELHLSGTELDCYAVIYCLSQSDNRYIAGVKRMMELLHKSEPSIISALKNLTDKGFVQKDEVILNNVKRHYYKALRPTKEILGTTLKNLSDPLKKFKVPTLKNLSGINNINIENKKEINKTCTNVQSKDDDFEDFWRLHRKGGKQQALKEWNKLKPAERIKAKQKIVEYLEFCKRSGRSTRDTSTYLHQHNFDDEWLVTPECYKHIDGEDERVYNFKEYMTTNHSELIYHRNPLTFEQGTQLFEKYKPSMVEWAFRYLKLRDIHQYFSIMQGMEAVLSENEYGNTIIND